VFLLNFRKFKIKLILKSLIPIMISQVSNSFNFNYEKNNFSNLSKKNNSNELSEEEQKQVEELQKRDREVRQHEQAHVTAGAGIVVSGPSYQYQRGPDGRQYAIGGEVQIDSSPIPDDPEATIRKMQQVQAAALAPADPSPQDRSVASNAARMQAQARMELAQKQMEESRNSNQEKNIFSVYTENINNSFIDMLI
jgi:hypothetical protein